MPSADSSLSQVKTRQEQQLKVRHFLPPLTTEPELFILAQDGGIFSASMAGSSAPSKFFFIGTVPREDKKIIVCRFQFFQRFSIFLLDLRMLINR
jgi:hypothetical protein